MNERDWTLLNAYADRELEPAEAEMLVARLIREPALAAELDRIRALKGRLAVLQTAPGRRSGSALVPNARSATIAVAASLLIAGVIGFAAIDPSSTTEPAEANLALTLHSDFAALSFPDEASVAAGVQVGDLPPPDLSGSNLRLVDLRRGAGPAGDAIAYHYRGPRGCRVSLVVGTSLDLPAGIALARRWEIGDRTLVLVADGMDPQRFAAIADYAESATRNGHPDDHLRLALEQRTAAARPCA